MSCVDAHQHAVLLYMHLLICVQGPYRHSLLLLLQDKNLRIFDLRAQLTAVQVLHTCVTNVFTRVSLSHQSGGFKNTYVQHACGLRVSSCLSGNTIVFHHQIKTVDGSLQTLNSFPHFSMSD